MPLHDQKFRLKYDVVHNGAPILVTNEGVASGKKRQEDQ